jgi:hypothetical protein
MDEKFLTKINQLTLYNPRVDLVKEHFMAFEQQPTEHRSDYWVSRQLLPM